jgi:hypothetical protein
VCDDGDGDACEEEVGESIAWGEWEGNGIKGERGQGREMQTTIAFAFEKEDKR